MFSMNRVMKIADITRSWDVQTSNEVVDMIYYRVMDEIIYRVLPHYVGAESIETSRLAGKLTFPDFLVAGPRKKKSGGLEIDQVENEAGKKGEEGNGRERN